jgi:hypothetical protein
MPRGRGGPRQGTPGKGYGNRTDMLTNYDQAKDTAATGGMDVPAPPAEATGAPGITPDDVPGIDAPTNYPAEPVTTGLMRGPGAGPQRDTRLEETKNLRQYLPLIELYLDNPDTPPSVMALFRYIRGA